MFFKKKTTPYDKETQIPVLRTSICSGERVAGFRDIETGRFHELDLITTDKELEEFMRKYEIDPADLRKEY